jgi:prevent-host-death family protein
MIKQEPVMTLRKNLGEILNGVEYKHDSVVITRAGKASAAIIDMNLFEKIRQMKNRFEILTSELQKSFSDITEHEQEILINKAVMEIRNKK